MFRMTLLPFVPLLATLVWAAVEDVRTRRIRNVLTLALAYAGLLQSFLSVGTVSPMLSGLGLAIGIGLGLSLFLLGGMGGGDVKLLAGVGAWMGPWGVLYTVAGAAIFGMVFVLVNAVRDGTLGKLLHSTTVLAANTMHVQHLGVTAAVESSRAHVSVGRPLPYAVPVLASATVVLLTMGA